MVFCILLKEKGKLSLWLMELKVFSTPGCNIVVEKLFLLMSTSYQIIEFVHEEKWF